MLPIHYGNTAGAILSVIFTFNRPQYLKNIIRSHQDCAPEIPLLIIDDDSSDPEQIALLEHLCGCEGVEVISASGSSDRHGGLYRNMNRALDIAYDKGFRFLNLLQDDMQVVRPATEDILRACALLDSTHDALQISLTFRKYLDVKNEPLLSSVSDLYLSQALHAADTGVIHLERAKSAGFTFQNSEREHSAEAIRLGFKNYVFRDPVFAFVPWPVYFRNRSRFGKPKAGKQTIKAIRTMSKLEVKALKERPITFLPCMEDWCRPVKGFWVAPYNYTNSWRDWGKRIAVSMKNKGLKRRFMPRIISAADPILIETGYQRKTRYD